MSFLINPYYAFGSGAPNWNPATLGNLDVSSNGWSGYTLRHRVASTARPSGSWNRVRFSVRGDTDEGITIVNSYIQIAGTDYNFSTTPIQAFWNGGSAGANISANTTLFCDPVTLAIGPSNAIVVAIYTSGTPDDYRARSVQSGYNSAYKNANDAATVSVSGYTTNGEQLHFDDFEVSL